MGLPAVAPGGPRACRSPTVTAPQAQSPDTQPPANISHGEAPVGGPNAPPAPIEAHLPPLEKGRVHHLRLEIVHATVTVAPGVSYAAWTFAGGVPGPALHVRQGDTVDFTLINRANIPHSMDFHAAEIAPNKYYVNVMPGDSLHYRFVARVPGAFMYHCGTAPVAMHIANGMYGALVVDPATPRPRAKEFVLVQSEFYFTPSRTPPGAHSRLAQAAEPRSRPRRLQWKSGPVRRASARSRDRRTGAALRGERRSQPDLVLSRGRRDLRTSISRWLVGHPAVRRADGEGAGRRGLHLRAAAAASGQLPVRHPRVRRCDQGRGRHVRGDGPLSKRASVSRQEPRNGADRDRTGDPLLAKQVLSS